MMNGAVIVLPESVLGPHSDDAYFRLRNRFRPRCRTGLLVLLSAVVSGISGCSGAAARSAGADVRLTAHVRPPAAAASVLASTAGDVVAADVARQLFASAPVVVVAAADRPLDLAAARERALRAHAPLLLTAVQAAPAAGSAVAAASAASAAQAAGYAAAGTISGRARGAAATADAALRTEIGDLHPRAVLAVGVAVNALSSQLRGIHVVTDPAKLPATSAPTPLHHVAVLVHAGPPTAATMAAATTAAAAGATVVPVRGDDPRADPAAITALAAARPQYLLAIGAGFGPAARLAARVAVAATGVQLPGGGQVIFPGHRLVALYGHPGAPALGALGQQDLPASIARARTVATSYQPLSKVPVVPTLEIIATVALGSPGKDGNYSGESSVASLRPWVSRAAAAGMYVVLDLQPGRASLLAQAKLYEPLLRLPSVGLALDPEWKLQRGQLPLRQIGGADIGEINSVVNWLAALTARRHLPQKLLVLHQFKLSMIGREQDLDTSHDDLAIVVHMDGQGTPEMKQATWNAVTQAAPPGVFFGWKNFYVKDKPTLTPRETMAKTPKPVMISYQ